MSNNKNANKKSKKRCIYCMEDIHIDAQKCSHCGQFQNWKKHLNFSSTILALLVALFSVISTLTLIKEKYAPENSKITLDFQFMKEGYIVMIVSNTGTKPGHIGSFLLEISYPKDTIEISMYPVELDYGSAFIEAGKVKHIEYYLPGSNAKNAGFEAIEYVTKTKNEKTITVSISMDVYEFVGPKKRKTIPISFEDLKTLYSQLGYFNQ